MSGDTGQFLLKEVAAPIAVGVGTGVLADEIVGKPKMPKQKPPKMPEIAAPVVIPPPPLSPITMPPAPQRPGGRTQQEQQAAKQERKRLQRASGRASTILVGPVDEEDEDMLDKSVKKKSLLGGS